MNYKSNQRTNQGAQGKTNSVLPKTLIFGRVQSRAVVVHYIYRQKTAGLLLDEGMIGLLQCCSLAIKPLHEMGSQVTPQNTKQVSCSLQLGVPPFVRFITPARNCTEQQNSGSLSEEQFNSKTEIKNIHSVSHSLFNICVFIHFIPMGSCLTIPSLGSYAVWIVMASIFLPAWNKMYKWLNKIKIIIN